MKTSSSPLLEAILNLSRFHREHEKFYASSPRELAVRLQRHARTLLALADHWSTATPQERTPFSPYEGAEDLNHPVALQLEGVLFMEGEGRPAELGTLVADLRSTATQYEGTGEWLSAAMEASWAMAAGLLDLDELADVLGDRHRIIANDWQAASVSTLVGRILARAADIVDGMDLAPAAVRADLAGERRAPARLYAAAELISHAADLSSESAGLVHDNERRWRTFRARVQEVVAS